MGVHAVGMVSYKASVDGNSDGPPCETGWNQRRSADLARMCAVQRREHVPHGVLNEDTLPAAPPVPVATLATRARHAHAAGRLTPQRDDGECACAFSNKLV